MRAIAKEMKVMNDGLRWNSDKGLWWDDVKDDNTLNQQPTMKCDGGDDMVKSTMAYLIKAEQAALDDPDWDADKKGLHDFTEWNAKKLVWECGNHRSLPTLRNAMYKHQKLRGVKYATLGSGPRFTKTHEERKAAADKMAADNDWARFEIAEE